MSYYAVVYHALSRSFGWWLLGGATGKSTGKSGDAGGVQGFDPIIRP